MIIDAWHDLYAVNCIYRQRCMQVTAKEKEIIKASDLHTNMPKIIKINGQMQITWCIKLFYK